MPMHVWLPLMHMCFEACTSLTPMACMRAHVDELLELFQDELDEELPPPAAQAPKPLAKPASSTQPAHRPANSSGDVPGTSGIAEVRAMLCTEPAKRLLAGLCWRSCSAGALCWPACSCPRKWAPMPQPCPIEVTAITAWHTIMHVAGAGCQPQVHNAQRVRSPSRCMP